MRGVLLLVVFFSAFPFIFINGPFWGILMWYWISLMNPQKEIWGAFSDIPYSFLVAVSTLLWWLVSRAEPKIPPLNKTTGLLVLLALWISITSIFGTGPVNQIHEKWELAEKMLLMTMVAYTLTTTRLRLDQLIGVCALSVAFFGFKGGLFSLLLTGGTARIYGPEGTMIGDNNDLGVALTMILPLLFYLRERYNQPYLKWPMAGSDRTNLFRRYFYLLAWRTGCDVRYGRHVVVALTAKNIDGLAYRYRCARSLDLRSAAMVRANGDN